jgi:hypothetical protein
VKISYHPIRHPLRPWRIVAPEVYSLHHTSRNGMNPDNPFYSMNNGTVAEWLSGLPAVTFMGLTRKAARFTYTGPRMPFSMVASGGKLKMYGDPPPIWLARRRDALLFKLTWA